MGHYLSCRRLLIDWPEIFMEGLQGAILRGKLRHTEPWTEARREIAAKYNDLPADSELVRPSEMPWAAARLSRLHTAR